MANKASSRFFHLNLLGDANDEDLCVLDSFVKGVEMDNWRVVEGAPFRDVYPEDARIYMSKSRKGIKLSDLLGNTFNALVVSREFKEIVEKHCGDTAEYLPFTLYDHRKRVHSKDYFIINPLGQFECLDYDASGCEFDEPEDEDDTDNLISIDEYVLDPKKVKKAPPLFRIGRDPAELVLSYPLAKDISDREFSNVYWQELGLSD